MRWRHVDRSCVPRPRHEQAFVSLLRQIETLVKDSFRRHIPIIKPLESRIPTYPNSPSNVSIDKPIRLSIAYA